MHFDFMSVSSSLTLSLVGWEGRSVVVKAGRFSHKRGTTRPRSKWNKILDFLWVWRWRTAARVQKHLSYCYVPVGLNEMDGVSLMYGKVGLELFNTVRQIYSFCAISLHFVWLWIGWAHLSLLSFWQNYTETRGKCVHVMWSRQESDMKQASLNLH